MGLDKHGLFRLFGSFESVQTLFLSLFTYSLSSIYPQSSHVSEGLDGNTRASLIMLSRHTSCYEVVSIITRAQKALIRQWITCC